MIEKEKKELTYKKLVNPTKLYDEIYAQQPELTPRIDEDGEIYVYVRIFTNGDTLKLWVPENIDALFFDSIVENHVIEIEIKEGAE